MITLTPSAADKIRQLLEKEGAGAQGLRLYVSASGCCSGYSYGMAFEHEAGPDDTVTESHGIKIFVDASTRPLVEGAEIDYVDGLMDAGFKIRNPQAVSTCGCGRSFSTAEDMEDDHDGCGCGCGCEG